MPQAAWGDADLFLREARVLAELDHPHVVPVYDVGRTADGLCYVVSKFIEGEDLAQRLKAGRVPLAQAVDLVEHLAEALHSAHLRGVVHRDVKPSNILLGADGRVYLADFGIAFSPDDQREGGSFGTLAYMSPEQVEGKALDHRSDIYSLGVVLYELLTGHLPHEATDPVELRRQIVSGTVASIPGVSKTGDAICRKCLSRSSNRCSPFHLDFPRIRPPINSRHRALSNNAVS